MVPFLSCVGVGAVYSSCAAGAVAVGERAGPTWATLGGFRAAVIHRWMERGVDQWCSQGRPPSAVLLRESSWATERAAARPDSIAPSRKPFQPLATSEPAKTTRPC